MTYTTTSVRGRVVPATGLVLVPPGVPPAGGWPVVVYGHITTGAADTCAPTRGVPGGDSLSYMQRGDALARRLLAAGVVVARPDFEGLGVPGGHPYLRGGSLGTSMVDMVGALRHVLPLGRDWVAAGHSEGAVAALNVADQRRELVPGMRLAGVAAITPVTRMEVLLRVFQEDRARVPGVTDGLLALAGLLLKGAAVADPAFSRLLRRGGLSDEAEALWPHLEQRCLEGLTAADSWGGLAPRDVLGPRGEEAAVILRRGLARIDVRHLDVGAVPVRIDEGVLDAVAPAPLTEELALAYQRRGADVTLARWLAGHSDVNTDAQAVPAIATWLLERLGRR